VGRATRCAERANRLVRFRRLDHHAGMGADTISHIPISIGYDYLHSLLRDSCVKLLIAKGNVAADIGK